ncbi:PDZ domain-containing protein [Clostridia bacterium OttesenSCG-928-O13]|nr:PDZ domain-containing protein [Clostridia bacterium OttesenSCG-928-O13]
MIEHKTRQVGSSREQGLYVASVSYENGFRVGDRIVVVNGTPVFNIDQLRAAVRSYPANCETEVTVLRSGKPLKLRVANPEPYPAA